jgi:hypothetical protein
LKILKTSTTNGKCAKKVMPQSDQVLTQLKTIDGHATWNVLKKQQSWRNNTTNPSSNSSPKPTLALHLMNAKAVIKTCSYMYIDE